jgi:hypothetical protein
MHCKTRYLRYLLKIHIVIALATVGSISAMQKRTRRQLDAQKKRITDRLVELRGELNRDAVAWLSVKSHVHYTTLARYFLYSGKAATNALRDRTLQGVAMALEHNPGWLRDGQGTRQLGVWPILTPAQAECDVADPDTQITIAIEQLRTLEMSLRVRAYRAAISAAIETVAGSGSSLGDEAYRCLMRLDAMRKKPAKRAG